jgi:hypothetical protein
MGKSSLADVPAEELKRELKRRGLQAEVEEFRQAAKEAADKAHEFLTATADEQKALRKELNQLLYRVTYRVRKFQAFAKARTARKGA